MASRLTSPRAPALGLTVLGAFTLWLVVQNTILALALLWPEPRRALTAAAVVFKACAALLAEFWSSPASALLAVAALVAVVAVPALIGRTAKGETIHG